MKTFKKYFRRIKNNEKFKLIPKNKPQKLIIEKLKKL